MTKPMIAALALIGLAGLLWGGPGAVLPILIWLGLVAATQIKITDATDKALKARATRRDTGGENALPPNT